MTFDDVLEQALEMLRRRGRVSYRALKVQFQLDDDVLALLRDEIVEVHQLARDQEGTMLVWTGAPGPAPVAPAAPAAPPPQVPLAYTPPYLAEKILTSRSALEGERKQVTVLFADLKGSMELLADRDPEEARSSSTRCCTHDGGRAPLRRHREPGAWAMASWPCLGPRLPMKTTPCGPAMLPWPCRPRSAAIARRCAASHGLEMQIRVGLNSGEVVVRAIGNDLHMDYSAIGQTTHLAARMEQLAPPGSIRLTADTLRLAEGLGAGHAPGSGAGEGTAHARGGV